MTDMTSANVTTKIDSDNSYDHVMFQSNFVTEYTGTHGVTPFDDEMFGGDDVAANLACSDHRLVWVRLRVPRQDDD